MGDPTPEQAWFVRYADECYVTTRLCYFAFMRNTVFRMAHHSFEYYFKAALAGHVTLRQLKALGHDLSRLGAEFEKRIRPLGNAKRIIDYVNRFDGYRYPDTAQVSHDVWGCPFDEFFQRFPEEKLQARLACFNLSDFDRVVEQLRNATVTREWSLCTGPSPLATDAAYRDNPCFSPPVAG